MAQKEIKRPIGGNSSFWRPIQTAITTGPVKFVARNFPGITPDIVTKVGGAFTAIGAGIKTISEIPGTIHDLSLYALALMTAGASADMFDGPLARERGESSLKGALTDLKSDRYSESGLVLARIAQAFLRKDIKGIAAATLNGITSPFPSLFRAKVEELGFVVPESGKNPVAFLGSRAPRSISSITATIFPTEFDLPIQPGLDTASSVSNLTLAWERFKALKQARKGQLKENTVVEAKELGKQKAEFLRKFAWVNSFAVLAVGIAASLNTFHQ